MFAGVTSTRPVRVTALVGLSSIGLLLSGVGTASAQAVAGQSTTAATGATGAVAFLGLPLSTAAWLMLGLVLLVAGLVASGRSRHRSGTPVRLSSTSAAAHREDTGINPVSAL